MDFLVVDCGGTTIIYSKSHKAAIYDFFGPICRSWYW